MTHIDHVTQPSGQTTLHTIGTVLANGPFDSISVAAAYVTTGGVQDLVDKIGNHMAGQWATVEKKWITSFDYCRTEPIALKTLAALPTSEVRVFNADFCLSRGGVPKVPFHPKAYLFRSATHEYALAGSGNLSRSGLAKGYEAGLVVGAELTAAATDGSPRLSVRRLRDWYETVWGEATALDEALLDRYTELYETAENLKNPVPTEDDVASGDTSKRALSNKDLQKLRVCRNLWIEAGNVTKNRGPNLPGNQLMMKRMTRVFFGFDAKDLTENSHVGTVFISFNGGSKLEYSLTYSDNKMDKLVLPIPGTDGPDAYDKSILVFETEKARHFDLKVLKGKDKAKVRKRSRAIDGDFKMTSGREWGVF